MRIRTEISPLKFERSGDWTRLDDVKLFRVMSGTKTSAPPVVFLHGIPSWSWLWRNVIPETGRYTWSIAVDLPGFGLSSSSLAHSFRPEYLANVIARFLDQAVGEHEPVSLVVHDYGALVGAEMIRQAPDRFPRLAIMNTSFQAAAWIGSSGPLMLLSVPWLGKLSMILARRWMLRLAMQPFVADPVARSPERVAGYWRPFEHGFGASLARLYQERPLVPEDFEAWRATLREYRGRALLLWGGRDPAFTLRSMDDIGNLMPRVETMVFEKASHFLPEERPRASGRRIRAFLEGRAV